MTLATGDSIPAFRILVTPDSMRVWAPILHDPNPIHLDPEVVRAKGLGDRVINQGPTNVAYMMNALHAGFPGSSIRSLEVRFLDNVYGGETVEAGGVITGFAEESGYRLTSCDVWLKVDDRGPVITGKAVVAQIIP
jgi:3-hydroxybutyryl-CoA dehydratase